MKWLKWIGLAVLVFLVVAQAFRPQLSNPPIDPAKTLQASAQASPQIQPTLDRACFDCHSNRTVWPWYAQVAPVSWLLASDVRGGRNQLNFSEWNSYSDARRAHKLDSIGDEVKGGDMPLKYYLPLHPAAHLSDADRAAIVVWASQQLGALERRGVKPESHHDREE